jgi:hypothetical protein
MLTAAEVALIVSGVALIGTGATVYEKRLADRREAWWGRTQWALEHTLSDQDTDRTIALLMLDVLQASKSANKDDRRMIGQVAEKFLPSPPPNQNETP